MDILCEHTSEFRVLTFFNIIYHRTSIRFVRTLLFFIAHLSLHQNQIYIPFTTLYTNFKYIEPWDFKQKLFYIKVQHYSVSSLMYQSFISITHQHSIYSTQCTPFENIYYSTNPKVLKRSYYGGCHGSFVADDVFRFEMNKNRIIYLLQAGYILFYCQ